MQENHRKPSDSFVMRPISREKPCVFPIVISINNILIFYVGIGWWKGQVLLLLWKANGLINLRYIDDDWESWSHYMFGRGAILFSRLFRQFCMNEGAGNQWYFRLSLKIVVDFCKIASYFVVSRCVRMETFLFVKITIWYDLAPCWALRSLFPNSEGKGETWLCLYLMLTYTLILACITSRTHKWQPEFSIILQRQFLEATHLTYFLDKELT